MPVLITLAVTLSTKSNVDIPRFTP